MKYPRKMNLKYIKLPLNFKCPALISLHKQTPPLLLSDDRLHDSPGLLRGGGHVPGVRPAPLPRRLLLARRPRGVQAHRGGEAEVSTFKFNLQTPLPS